MEVTKKILEQRIEGLMPQANNLLAQYNQIQGAIAYCHQLIADLKEEIPTVEEAVSQFMPGAEILGMEDEDEEAGCYVEPVEDED